MREEIHFHSLCDQMFEIRGFRVGGDRESRPPGKLQVAITLGIPVRTSSKAVSKLMTTKNEIINPFLCSTLPSTNDTTLQC